MPNYKDIIDVRSYFNMLLKNRKGTAAVCQIGIFLGCKKLTNIKNVIKMFLLRTLFFIEGFLTHITKITLENLRKEES